MQNITIHWDWIISGFALAFAIYVHFRDRANKQKKLTYDYKAFEISQREPGFPGLELVYQGRSVYRASIVFLTVKNAGNVPIVRSDFEEPLTFTFTSYLADETVLAQHSSRVFPSDVVPHIDLLNGDAREGTPTLKVAPLLLNPGDSFGTVILVDDFANAITVSGRIAGVSKIVRAPSDAPPRSRRSRRWLLTACAMSLGMFGGLTAARRFPAHPRLLLAHPHFRDAIGSVLLAGTVIGLVKLAEKLVVAPRF